MCGICGIYAFNDVIDPSVVHRMNQILKHRGPDDEGYIAADTRTGVFSPRTGKDTIPSLKNSMDAIAEATGKPYNLGFGHRRLSIIDLSENGHQPMT